MAIQGDPSWRHRMINCLSPDAERELLEYQERLTRFIERIVAKSNIPGLCIELSANGCRVGAAVGYLALNSQAPISRFARFHLGDIGNMLLSLAVLKLAAEGALDLESPVSRYLSELSDTQFGSEVCLWHLLCHSGGHEAVYCGDRGLRAGYAWPDVIETLKRTSFLFIPGTVFSYSSLSTTVVGEIVSRVSQKSALDVVRSHFLAPLGIEAGSFASRTDGTSIKVASHSFDTKARQTDGSGFGTRGEIWRSFASDLTMSLVDLVSLYEEIIDARTDASNTALAIGQSPALALQHQAVAIPFATCHSGIQPLPLSAGLGCARFLPDWYGKNGPFVGQSMAVRYHADQRIVLAVAANVHVPLVCQAILDDVLSSLSPDSDTPEPIVDSNPCAARELVGHYVGCAGGEAQVTSSGNDIVCEIPDRSSSSGTRLKMELDAYNRWTVRSTRNRLPLGVFRDPTSGTPCLMIGLVAHKKRAQGRQPVF